MDLLLYQVNYYTSTGKLKADAENRVPWAQIKVGYGEIAKATSADGENETFWLAEGKQTIPTPPWARK